LRAAAEERDRKIVPFGCSIDADGRARKYLPWCGRCCVGHEGLSVLEISLVGKSNNKKVCQGDSIGGESFAGHG
jgi:hypothetical protein